MRIKSKLKTSSPSIHPLLPLPYNQHRRKGNEGHGQYTTISLSCSFMVTLLLDSSAWILSQEMPSFPSCSHMGFPQLLKHFSNMAPYHSAHPFRNTLLQHLSPQAAAPPDPLHGMQLWPRACSCGITLLQLYFTWGGPVKPGPPGLLPVYHDPCQSSLLSWKLKYLAICSFSSSICSLVSPNTFCVGASDDPPNYWLPNAQRDRADENNRLSSQKYYFRTLRYD